MVARVLVVVAEVSIVATNTLYQITTKLITYFSSVTCRLVQYNKTKRQNDKYSIMLDSDESACFSKHI